VNAPVSQSSVEPMTLGEISRTLTRLDDGQKELIARIDLMRGEFVHRGEYDQRSVFIDRELRDIKARVDRVEEGVAANAGRSGSSGWTIASVVIGGVVGLGSVLTLLITLMRIIPDVP